MLDSDDEGKKAHQDLLKGGPRGKQMLKPDYILPVGQLFSSEPKLKTAFGNAPVEIEDLVPVELCVRAAKAYAKQYWEMDDTAVSAITPESIIENKIDGQSVYDAIKRCMLAIPGNPHIDKIGFARAVVDLLPKPDKDGQLPKGTPSEFEVFEHNMLILLTKLKKMQRGAEKEQNAVRVSQKADRLKRNFVQDHPESATREQAALVLEEIESALDETPESDFARAEIQKLRRDFQLNEDLFQKVPQFDNFKQGLERIKYAGVMASKQVQSTVNIAKNHEPPLESTTVTVSGTVSRE